MSKFAVGNAVRRVGVPFRNHSVGSVYRITAVSSNGDIQCNHEDVWYCYKQYELHDTAKTVPHGGKDDANKPNPGLLFQGCAGALAEVCKVLDGGAKKYAANSWQTVPNGIERYRAAAERHKQAIDLEGLDAVNEDFGLLHLDHLICDLLFIRQLKLNEANNASK